VKKVFLDAETYYDPKEGYDLKSMSMTAYIMDPRFKVHGFGVQEEGKQLTWVSANDVPKFVASVDWPNTSVVAHNVKFDGAILAWKYSVKPHSWIDTKAMAKAVLGTTIQSVSLTSCASYLGLPPKGEMKTAGLLELDSYTEAELSTYCLRDTEICEKLFHKLEPKFPASQYELMDWTARCFIEPMLAVDKSIAEQVAQELEKEQDELIRRTGVDRSVFASNPQFASLLESKGFTVPKKLSPRTGKRIPALAMGDTEFLDLTGQADGELKLLCQARIAAKQTMEKKRAEKLAGVGALYPFDIEFSGARQTHRFSGGSGAGGNPQNFPRESKLRAAIKAPEGFKVVVADFASIELRVSAYLAQEEKMIAGIEADRDLYCDFGTEFYGRTITKEDKDERKYSKAAMLGLGYGMGPEKFQKTVKVQTGQNVSFDTAQNTVWLYRDYFPAVPALWKRCESLFPAMQNGFKVQIGPITTGRNCLILPSGLRLQYPGLQKNGREWAYTTYKKLKQPEAVKLYGGKITENICQALAGEICKEAITRLLAKGIRPHGQVHDELLIVCREEEELATMEAVYEAMSTAPSWWPEIKLDASVGSGGSWGEAKG